jgi:hypothetical protein
MSVALTLSNDTSPSAAIPQFSELHKHVFMRRRNGCCTSRERCTWWIWRHILDKSSAHRRDGPPPSRKSISAVENRGMLIVSFITPEVSLSPTFVISRV